MHYAHSQKFKKNYSDPRVRRFVVVTLGTSVLQLRSRFSRKLVHFEVCDCHYYFKSHSQSLTKLNRLMVTTLDLVWRWGQDWRRLTAVSEIPRYLT